MAKTKPTPISEQAVCNQPTVYTFNFKEVPISKYAETLDILFHNPDYNELVEKRNKLVKSADRLRPGTSEMANIVRTIQQRDRRLADIMYASIVQANIRSEVSNDFLSFDTLLKYYVDYRKDGMRECVSRMAANLDKVTFLADMLESVVTDVKDDMRQVFDDVVEFHQFEVLAHQLFGHIVAGGGIMLVYVHALEFYGLAVDEQCCHGAATGRFLVEGLDFDAAEAHILWHIFAHLAVLLYAHHQSIEVRCFRRPGLHFGQLGFEVCLCGGICLCHYCAAAALYHCAGGIY